MSKKRKKVIKGHQFGLISALLGALSLAGLVKLGYGQGLLYSGAVLLGILLVLSLVAFAKVFLSYRRHLKGSLKEGAKSSYTLRSYGKKFFLPRLKKNLKKYPPLYITLLVGVLLMSLFAGAQIAKTFAYAPDEFVTTWKTDNPGVSASNQIRIPTTGAGYNYTVDWGDGNITSGHTGDVTHTYGAPGTYEVIITGSFPRIYFDGGTDSQKILTVEQWGSNSWTSMGGAFTGASNLTVPAVDAPNLSAVTGTFRMFAAATSLNSDIENWDVSNITDMSEMFSGASSFNQPLDGWDVSSVTNMSEMFSGASSFNQPLNSWDVSSVEYMDWMFLNAEMFDQSLSSWNVSGVTNMVYMFRGATAFNGDVTTWNVSAINSTDGMFMDAASFNQPIGSWNVSSVESMASMFLGATDFNQPLNSWDTSNVWWTMSSMFEGAISFNQPLDNWNVSSVTFMDRMFTGATVFNQPLDNWDVSNVEYMDDMLVGTAFSTTNYDNLLAAWSLLTLQNNVSFGASAQYCTGSTARASIISTYSWTITDGGEGTCPVLTLPVVVTNPATSVTYNSATLNGDVTSSDDPVTAVGFEWGETLAYGTDTGSVGSGLGSFSEAISLAECETTYNFRAYATNSVGTAYGDNESFTTEACDKSVVTEEVESLSLTLIKFKGLTAGTLAEDFVSGGFEWGDSELYGQSVNGLSIDGDKRFTHQIDLACGTTYHYRAFAIDESEEVVNGQDKTLTIECEEEPEVPVTETPTPTAPKTGLLQLILIGTVLGAGAIGTASYTIVKARQRRSNSVT